MWVELDVLALFSVNVVSVSDNGVSVQSVQIVPLSRMRVRDEGVTRLVAVEIELHLPYPPCAVVVAARARLGSKRLTRGHARAPQDYCCTSLPDSFFKSLSNGGLRGCPHRILPGKCDQSRRSKRCVTTSAGIVPYGMLEYKDIVVSPPNPATTSVTPVCMSAGLIPYTSARIMPTGVSADGVHGCDRFNLQKTVAHV
jgi:hypothetical protein